MRKYIILMFAVLVMMLPMNASAYPFASFSDGYGSHADFELVTIGTDQYLQVTLSTNRVATVNSEVLLGFFFTGPALTKYSATVPAGEIILAYDDPKSTTLGSPLDVGGHWGYEAGLADMPQYGIFGNSVIGAAGWDILGPKNLFQDIGYVPTQPDGGDFGLTAGNAVTSNGYSPLVNNSTVFLFTYSGDAPTITDPFFQYGTTLNPVPIPAAA